MTAPSSTKERPILFSAPMVRAILAGTKTQTRRIVKPQPDAWCGGTLCVQFTADDQRLGRLGKPILCPYGIPGDRLWVREAFSGPHCMEKCAGCPAVPPSKWGRSSSIWYWADGNPSIGDWTRPRPSIHMPRWASRITLEITDVRVERLQEISEADAIAEGIHRNVDGLWSGGVWKHLREPNRYADPCNAYCDLWDSINDPGSWDENPWVWVVCFRRVP